jgi:hypothetical protein
MPLLHSILVAPRNPFDSGTRTSSAATVVPGRFRDKIECLECRAHKLRPGSKDGLLRAGCAWTAEAAEPATRCSRYRRACSRRCSRPASLWRYSHAARQRDQRRAA